MDDILPTIIAVLLVIAAVVFDWPRAVAGLIIGIGARRIGRAWLLIPIGVVAVAAVGEFIYPLLGRTSGPGWPSFGTGLVSAGACAYGLHRVLWRLFDGA